MIIRFILSCSLNVNMKNKKNMSIDLLESLEKLYTKLARDDASPPKRSAAYILRHNTAETVKQVYRFRIDSYVLLGIDSF